METRLIFLIFLCASVGCVTKRKCKAIYAYSKICNVPLPNGRSMILFNAMCQISSCSENQDDDSANQPNTGIFHVIIYLCIPNIIFAKGSAGPSRQNKASGPADQDDSATQLNKGVHVKNLGCVHTTLYFRVLKRA